VTLEKNPTTVFPVWSGKKLLVQQELRPVSSKLSGKLKSEQSNNRKQYLPEALVLK
jgi:uncharacterized protein YlzI (FlbEa/FlbD family)